MKILVEPNEWFPVYEIDLDVDEPLNVNDIVEVDEITFERIKKTYNDFIDLQNELIRLLARPGEDRLEFLQSKIGDEE